MKWHDRIGRCGQVLLLLGNDVVEIGNDGAEHAEPPKVALAGYRSRYPSHQQKSGNDRWRCPGADAAFGFIIEQLFALNSYSAILPEGEGSSCWDASSNGLPHKGHVMRHPSSWLRKIGAGSSTAGPQFKQHCIGRVAMRRSDDCATFAKVMPPRRIIKLAACYQINCAANSLKSLRWDSQN